MTAIVKNIRSAWSVCGLSAEGCVKAVKRELLEMVECWTDAETYWREHPEFRPMYFYHHI